VGGTNCRPRRTGVPYRISGGPLAFNSRFASGLTGGGARQTLVRWRTASGGVGNLVDHIGDLLAGNLEVLRAAVLNADILTHAVWPNLKSLRPRPNPTSPSSACSPLAASPTRRGSHSK
jgi:hypothetical protein